MDQAERQQLKEAIHHGRKERARREARIEKSLNREEDVGLAGVLKEFKDLARRVNAIPGWTAQLVDRGAHEGRGYVVYHDEKFVCRFSGSPSVPDLALKRAEAELRRLGCPLPYKDQTKGAIVPAPSAQEKDRSQALRPRLKEAAQRMGDEEFLDQALRLAEEKNLPFAATRYQARKSMRGFLSGKFLTGNVLDRFEEATAAVLNGTEPEPIAEPQTAPETAPEPATVGAEPGAEPPTENPEPTAEHRGGALRTLVDALEDAETRLHVHRDPYLKARDEVTTLRLEIIELMQQEDDL